MYVSTCSRDMLQYGGTWTYVRLHNTGERLFKFVMTHIPHLAEYNKELIKTRAKRTNREQRDWKQKFPLEAAGPVLF